VLQRFRLQGVKLDPILLAGLEDGDRTGFVAAVVQLAAALHLPVTATGVDTPAQAERLRGLACDLAQGAYLSAPLEGAAVEAVLGQDAGWAGRLTGKAPPVEHDPATGPPIPIPVKRSHR
jgi:EAL domain-containing protein (putative c-di-GMP-specific phosphodiesterase class I)